jgi:hypothetical protein
MRPPVRSLRRRVTSTNNYGRKLKPTPKRENTTNEKHLKTHEKRRAIMAVAASLALGTLSILAGQATALKPNVFDIEPKALWGACMYFAHTSGCKIDAFTGFMCLAGGGALADLSIKFYLI